jgi:MFS family permease
MRASALRHLACRLVQGIAVGGEWGGAVLMTTEHSPPLKRGFYGSLVQIGFPLGMALGTASFFARRISATNNHILGLEDTFHRECGARCNRNFY